MKGLVIRIRLTRPYCTMFSVNRKALPAALSLHSESALAPVAVVAVEEADLVDGRVFCSPTSSSCWQPLLPQLPLLSYPLY